MSWAQPDEIAALRELISEGYYALAAQVEGPRLVETFPESLEAHYLYAHALYLTGNIERAAAQLEEAKALTGPSGIPPRLAHLDALLRAARGDFGGAIKLLARTFTRAPGYLLAMDWGRVAWEGGDVAGAVRAYRAAASTPEGQGAPWATLNLARLLALQGEHLAAIGALETTLDILEQTDTGQLPSPAYTEAFYRLGAAYEALGRRDEARSNYQAARSVDPNYAPAASALGRLDDVGP